MKRRFPVSLGTRDEDPLAVFVRGATVGAFVGAVIAGSTIWRSVRRRAASAPAVGPASASTPSDPTASVPAPALPRPPRGVPSVEAAEAHRP
jgi:hypothetical protein